MIEVNVNSMLRFILCDIGVAAIFLVLQDAFEVMLLPTSRAAAGTVRRHLLPCCLARLLPPRVAPQS